MWKKMLLTFVFLLIGAGAISTAPSLYIRWRTQSQLLGSPVEAPSAPVAIVFGAGLYRNGTPMPVLADRVRTAVTLYQAGKVAKILMSGDNSYPDYNEPESMRQLALSLGVPDSAIAVDYAGRRTYDTCYRARFIFGIREALIVTQAYHLPRAVYTCSQLGIRATGVASDLRRYRFISMAEWQVREVAAAFVALLDLHIFHPQPILGPLEPL
jgi:SanA protein